MVNVNTSDSLLVVRHELDSLALLRLGARLDAESQDTYYDLCAQERELLQKVLTENAVPVGL
jgi:hypothetical protein